MARYNDIDIKQWKNYTEIETDSLWIIDKRDNSGAHLGDYHGNFVEKNHKLKIFTFCGDSSKISMQSIFDSVGIKKLQFVIFHPPFLWSTSGFEVPSTTQR